MKIDFYARFQDVSKLLDAPPPKKTLATVGGNFDGLIADIAPDRPQPAVKSAQIVEAAAGDRAPAGNPMASYSFINPQMKLPDFTPETPQIADDEPVTPQAPSVKTPTLLSVRRTVAEASEEAKPKPEQVQVSSVRRLVEDAGTKFGVDPQLSLAVVSRESSFNPRAVSADGRASKGLFQLLDRTGLDLRERFGMDKTYDPFDPEQNVYLGVGYLSHLQEIFSKETELPNEMRTVAAANSASLEKLAVAAFNAGEGRVASAQQRARAHGHDPSEYHHVEAYLPESTREYVARVIEAKADFGPRAMLEIQ